MFFLAAAVLILGCWASLMAFCTFQQVTALQAVSCGGTTEPIRPTKQRIFAQVRATPSRVSFVYLMGSFTSKLPTQPRGLSCGTMMASAAPLVLLTFIQELTA